MSLKSIDRPEKNLAVLEVIIEKKAFDEEVTKVYRQKAPKLSVPGFRKGKAPRPIVEKMFGSGIFYEDALNELMPAAIEKAVEEAGIEAVSRPEVDEIDLDNLSDGVVFKAKLYTRPEVEIKDYKGLEATKTVIKITDEEVDKEIGRVRERNARSIEVTDRPAQGGDTVKIDFEGFVGDDAFEGGKGEGHSLKLGSGQFIPGFEEQIEGKNIGDEFDVSVSFPEEYHAPDLAGKAAVFKCKLHEIRFDELPELDDEFAQDVSEFDTFEAYKADVKSKIEESNEKRSEFAVEEQLVDGIVANLEADIPACMIDDETDQHLRDYAFKLQSQGMSLEMFTQYTGQSIDGIKASLRPNAERQVKTRLALEKIAQLENIQVGDEDVEAEYEKIAEMYNIDLEAAKGYVAPEDMKKDVAVRQAVEFVKEHAVIKTEEMTAEEFAAKREAQGLPEIVEEDGGDEAE